MITDRLSARARARIHEARRVLNSNRMGIIAMLAFSLALIAAVASRITWPAFSVAAMILFVAAANILIGGIDDVVMSEKEPGRRRGGFHLAFSVLCSLSLAVLGVLVACKFLLTQ